LLSLQNPHHLAGNTPTSGFYWAHVMPTSMTTAPDLTMLAVISWGFPTAATWLEFLQQV